jgi:hypothetical protein
MALMFVMISTNVGEGQASGHRTSTTHVSELFTKCPSHGDHVDVHLKRRQYRSLTQDASTQNNHNQY